MMSNRESIEKWAIFRIKIGDIDIDQMCRLEKTIFC